MDQPARRQPPKQLTPEVVREVARVVRDGNCRNVAAALLKIHEVTLSRWMARGSKAPVGSIYRQLFDAVTEAEARWEADTVKVIQEDAVDNVKSAQWLLTRHPQAKKRWAQTEGPSAQVVMAEVDMAAARARFVDMLTRLAADLDIPVPDAPPPAEGASADDANQPG